MSRVLASRHFVQIKGMILKSCAGRHILNPQESALSIALLPAPVRLLAHPRLAPAPIFRQERSNQPDVFGVSFPSLDDHAFSDYDIPQPEFSRKYAYFFACIRAGGDILLASQLWFHGGAI
jgi:hypothetical protein